MSQNITRTNTVVVQRLCRPLRYSEQAKDLIPAFTSRPRFPKLAYQIGDPGSACRELAEQHPMKILVARMSPRTRKALVEMLKRMGYRAIVELMDVRFSRLPNASLRSGPNGRSEIPEVTA